MPRICCIAGRPRAINCRFEFGRLWRQCHRPLNPSPHRRPKPGRRPNQPPRRVPRTAAVARLRGPRRYIPQTILNSSVTVEPGTTVFTVTSAARPARAGSHPSPCINSASHTEASARAGLATSIRVLTKSGGHAARPGWVCFTRTPNPRRRTRAPHILCPTAGHNTTPRAPCRIAPSPALG